jgi:hypothetical protein
MGIEANLPCAVVSFLNHDSVLFSLSIPSPKVMDQGKFGLSLRVIFMLFASTITNLQACQQRSQVKSLGDAPQILVNDRLLECHCSERSFTEAPMKIPAKYVKVA